MAKPEVAGEVRFGSEIAKQTWPIIIDNKHIGNLFKDDGFQVRFWLHGKEYTSVSLDALSEISLERRRLLNNQTLVPSFWLDFKSTMDEHSLHMIRNGVHIGSLQWHDNFLVVLTRLQGWSDVTIAVDDIDQILRKRDALVAAKRKKSL